MASQAEELTNLDFDDGVKELLPEARLERFSARIIQQQHSQELAEMKGQLQEIHDLLERGGL